MKSIRHKTIAPDPKKVITNSYEIAMSVAENFDGHFDRLEIDFEKKVSNAIKSEMKEAKVKPYTFDNIEFVEADSPNPHHAGAYYTFDLHTTQANHNKYIAYSGIGGE